MGFSWDSGVWVHMCVCEITYPAFPKLLQPVGDSNQSALLPQPHLYSRPSSGPLRAAIRQLFQACFCLVLVPKTPLLDQTR